MDSFSSRKAQSKFLIIALWVVAGGIVNLVLAFTNMKLETPLFMDSIATCVVAALWGPWAGMACAFCTHAFMEIYKGFSGAFMPFAVCNMASGLITGLWARGSGLQNINRAVFCALTVTLANAVLGAFIAVCFFGGIAGHATDYLVSSFLTAGSSLITASFWARIPANLIDKGIAVAAAVVAVKLRQRKETQKEEADISRR